METKIEDGEKRFILWDPRDGNPPRNESGEIITSGCLGALGLSNVYLKAYGTKPEGSKRYEELEPGECVAGVCFRLSGVGYYDVYRVS